MRFILALLFALIASSAAAQERRPSHCIAVAEADPALIYVQPASFRDPVAEFGVRITYVDHSMFLIQSEDGVDAMTDFTGFYGNVDFLPDVVTMNNAHSTHWTRFPDPGIPHVLEGWADAEGARDHYLDLGGMLVRNIHTDIRDFSGTRVRENGNSIFVFEVAGLCVGHMGHLHHEPDDAQYAAIGRLDVVMVAVDGGLTLDHASVVRIMERLRSSVIIPMHWFGRGTLDRFLTAMGESGFAVDRRESASLTMSLRDLPDRPTVMVLEPAFLSEE